MFTMFLILFIVPFSTSVDITSSFRYDYNYHSEVDGWMKLHRVPATFYGAWLRCHLEDSILASSINNHFGTAMKTEMRSNRLSSNGVFTGIHGTFSKGDFFSIEDITSSFRYDYNYHSEVDGWMKLHRVPATFHDAWLRCHLEGSILASPINNHFGTAMKTEMRSYRLSSYGIFTGIHGTFSKGEFFSIEGIPLNKMPLEWMPSEPNNKNNDEDCILYASNGTVADVKCSEVHSYICYKKRTKNMFVTGCGTIDREYILEPETGSCYKFHRVARNWTRAFMTCAAEGGHLAIINSDTEANVLRKIFAKNPKDSIKSNLHSSMKDIALIGFHDWSERGIWTTIHGSSLTEAGYDHFSEGQPDNTSSGQYCGGMFRSGRLNDVWCHRRGPFICEKSPDSLNADDDPLKLVPLTGSYVLRSSD